MVKEIGTITKEEWNNLVWENTGIEFLTYSTFKELGEALGYSLYGKIEPMNDIYRKGNKLYLISSYINYKIAELPERLQILD